MAFLPDFRVEVAFTSGVRTLASARTWTDISDYVELGDGITINRGRGDEFSQTSPSTLSLVLDNTDGRFTPGKATSPYYPNVKLGRPIRVLANLVTDGDLGTFNTSITGMVAGNGALAQVASPSVSGNALRLTATAAADSSATSGATTADGYKVSPGASYQFSLSTRRDSGTARTVRLQVIWYTAANAVISTDHLGSVTPTTTAYSTMTATAVAPATADHVRLQALVVASGAGQIHYFDDFRVDSIRFTGFVDEWPVEWRQGVDANAHAEVTASSRQARLGEGAELRSVIETEIMLDDPVAYYPLGEPEGALHATELTGSDTVGMYNYHGGSGITFGTGTGPHTDGLPAVQVFPTRDDEQQVMLAAYFKDPSLSEVTIECFAAIPRRNNDDVISVIALYENLLGKEYRVLQMAGSQFGSGAPGAANLEGNYLEFIGGATSFIGTSGTYEDPSTAFDVWDSLFTATVHHFALTFVPGATPVLKTYIDGELFVTKSGMTGSNLASMPNFSHLVIGNYQTSSGDQPFSVAHAAVYDYVLPDDRIEAHAKAGLDGFTDEFAGSRITRYATYAGIDTSEIVADTGSTALAHIDTTGAVVDSLFRTIEATEGGVLYDGRDGSLVFRDRDHRYLAPSAFTIDAAQQQLEQGLRPTLDRSTLVNSATARSSDGTVERRYEDTSAADDYGLRRIDLEVATTDEDEVFQAAAWRVNRYKEPQARIGDLQPVDVLMLSSTTRAAIVAADISTRFTLANLPAQAPAATSDFFVEGITETIALESWRFQFNASPASIYDDLFILDASVLDGTDVLAY